MALLRLWQSPVEDVGFVCKTKAHMKVLQIRIGDLTISENVSDPISFETSIAPHLSFLVPLSGSAVADLGDRVLEYPSSSHIIQRTFNRRMTLRIEDFHHVTFQPGFGSLKAELSVYLSDADGFLETAMHEDNSTHVGAFGHIDYRQELLALLSVIRNACGDVALLTRIGMEDVVVKTLAEYLILRSGRRLDPAAGPAMSAKRSEKAVDVICDFIMSNVGRPLTIAGMEKLTGLTGRAIAYGFEARFNCSPQQWQRNFLLDVACRMLELPGMPKSVKAVAYELGFSSPHSFSLHYRKRYGHYPSQRIGATADGSPEGKETDE